MSAGPWRNRIAFSNGYAAAEAGKSQIDCPNYRFTSMRLAWGDGWLAAVDGLVNDPSPWGWLPGADPSGRRATPTPTQPPEGQPDAHPHREQGQSAGGDA